MNALILMVLLLVVAGLPVAYGLQRIKVLDMLVDCHTVNDKRGTIRIVKKYSFFLGSNTIKKATEWASE